MRRLAAYSVILIPLLIWLSWNHYLPGGWKLKNLFSSPEARATAFRVEHRNARLESFADDGGPAAPGSVLFYGSSTIEYFPLEASFPGKFTINRGIGNDSSGDMLSRLEASLPEAAAERIAAVVLYAGAVDLRREGCSIRVVTSNVRRLMKALSERLPKARILLLGVLPHRAEARAESPATRKMLNAALKAMAEALGQEFVTVESSRLPRDDGHLDPLYSRDNFHLNAAGYAELTAVIKGHGGEVAKILR